MALKRGRPEYVSSESIAMIERVRASARSARRNFIEKFLWIKNYKRQMQQLTFNHSQELAWKIIEQELAADHATRLVFLKGRQVGMTTLIAGLVFSEVYNNDNTDAVVMSHLKERTMKLFQMHHLFLKNLPIELQLPLSRSSRLELVWDHTNSGISLATAGTTSFGRGGTVPIVHASEAAFYGSLYETLGALEPSIPDEPTSIVVVESTAYGTGTEFHAFWNAAVEGDNDFVPVFLPWYKDPKHEKRFKTMQDADNWRKEYLEPDNDLLGRMEQYKLTLPQVYWYWWYRKNKLHSDYQLMCQEFPCDPQECFISSGMPVFPMRQLVDAKALVRSGKIYDPILPWATLKELIDRGENRHLVPNRDPYVEIWNTPAADRKYVISADTAEGVEGGDYSCAYVFDLATTNIVAVLHGRIEPHEFARSIAKLGAAYNDALIAPEIHGVGIATLAKLKDIYYNLYRWRVFDAKGVVETQKIGWETNIMSRRIMITNGKATFGERHKQDGFIPDKYLLDEISNFVYTGLDMKAQAGHGCHDDRVMTWLIGQIVCAQEADLIQPTAAFKAEEKLDDSKWKIDEMIRNRVKIDYVNGHEWDDYNPGAEDYD